MRNAKTVVVRTIDVVAAVRRTSVFACCILHLAFLACSKAAPATSAAAAARTAIAQLQRDITRATQGPGVQRGVWGIAVHSMDRNERLFELQPRALLVPASVAKIAAVATAAEAVGWDYQFETSIRATGPVTDGSLAGDLLVIGSGDPTIGGRGGEDVAAWAAALKAAGIRRIEGRIIGDDDAIEEPRPQLAWAWDDLGYPAGAIFGALNYAENRMTVTLTPGPGAGAPVSLSVDPPAGTRPLANRVVTGGPGTTQLVWPEQRPGEPSLTIAGTMPAGTAPARLTVAVGNPTIWFANALRIRLQSQGIDVLGDAWDVDDVTPPPDRSRAAVVFTHRSRPLRDIVQPLMKDSINLYAEAVMRLNAARGQLPTNDAALEGFAKRLEGWGVPALSQQLVDGSGLSRRGTMSAEAVLAILQHMHDPSGASALVAALPVAGVDGTLSGRMRNTPAAGNVRAKTGTMSNIRSLAGYVNTRDGEKLAFVAMVNNFEGPGAAANQALDAIAISLASFSRRGAQPVAAGRSK
jgi:D-alanyl-D-alanine carboxypeptidase/D-alanyl-D-alanine-endopeptidase (penicillin-binding protein 4)